MEDAILWAILTGCGFVLIAVLDELTWELRHYLAEKWAREWRTGRGGPKGA